MADRPQGSLSGLTENEAKEFHSLFMSSFIGFIAVAAVAHVLAWVWRPWLPGVRGYVASIGDSTHQAIAAISQFIG